MNELAAALGDDPNFATTVTNSLAGKLGVSDNAVTASAWQTPRTITLSGDVTGSASIDGSADVTITTTSSAADDALAFAIALG